MTPVATSANPTMIDERHAPRRNAELGRRVMA